MKIYDKMSLRIPKKCSKFNNIELTEIIDRKRVKYLLSCELNEEYTDENGYKKNEYKQLSNILHKITENSLKVRYNHSKYGLNVGRVFANGALSLQSLRKDIRHYLAYDKYDDLDMVNCYYVILEQLCKNSKINPKQFSEITKYVNDRYKILSKIKCDKNISKKLYLTILHGGNVKTWRNENNTHGIKVKVNKLKKQVELIGRYIHSINKELNRKWWGSTMSVVLQYYENMILEIIYGYLKENGFDMCNAVLCFDGIMIPKNIRNNNDLLIKLEREIFKKSGLKIKLAFKQMNKTLFKKI